MGTGVGFIEGSVVVPLDCVEVGGVGGAEEAALDIGVASGSGATVNGACDDAFGNAGVGRSSTCEVEADAAVGPEV